jgi:outer membrane protein assembly factor BamB
LKHCFIIWFLLATGLLAACSADIDNSEPPAELTIIEDQMKLELLWRVDTLASSNSASYRLRPLIIDDLVYSIDTSGLIYEIDLVSGRKNWKYATRISAITGLSGNPETIVATSKDGLVAAYRLVEKGLTPLWQIDLGTEIRATPVVDGSQVFVRTVDGKLHSLSIKNGNEQWVVSRRVPALSLTGNSEPLVTEELIFSGFDDGSLIAYDRENGKTVWDVTISLPSGRTEVERLVDLDGRFVLSDGVIYVSSFQGKLAAIQAINGDVLWAREFSSFHAIAIDQDALYLSSDNSHLWSIDRRTGTALWKQDVLNARKVTAPTIFKDKLVVGDLDGYLHWFNKEDGSLTGRIRATNARSYVQPQTWQNTVLTLDKYGLLVSVSPSAPTTSY